MVNYLKDGIILSNWVQLGMGEDWIKHRIDHRSPIDIESGFVDFAPDTFCFIKLIKMRPMLKHNPSVFYVTFQGEKIKYIEAAWRETYGSASFPEEMIEKMKNHIDLFLNKIDNLLIFT